MWILGISSDHITLYSKGLQQTCSQFNSVIGIDYLKKNGIGIDKL